MVNEIDSNSKRAYKVYISSTYLDNKERRRIVRDAITMAGMEWHGMEIFTASERPTMEECLRMAREADVFVGIIAWRYGWEPDGKKSISEMEYEAANERLMFLIDPELPVNTDKDFDPEPGRWIKQTKLDAFKRKISDDQLSATFNEATLGARVLHALNQWRKQRKAPHEKPAPVQATDPKLNAEIRAYCEKAESLHGYLPVTGFVTQLKVPIDIEDIYAPLRAIINIRGIHEERFSDAIHAEKVLMRREASLDIPLPEAFRQSEMRGVRGIVILGDPGSGKTTHLKRLALWRLRNDSETIGLQKDMLPVFLPLRDLRSLDQGFDAFIQEQLAIPHLNTPDSFGERLLKRGGLLFLLDGLDEVADLSRREQVAEWIMAGLRVHPTCRFVVTCRFAGYSPTVRLSGDFLEMHIRPLSSDQVERFVRNWYKNVERGLAISSEQAEGVALENAENLIKRLREPDFRSRRVFELTLNPLLLANICLVHRFRGELPRKRARLYEECIDVLLEHWREAKGLKIHVTAREGRRALQPAALWLHGEEGRTKASAEELSPYIEPVLKAIGWAGGSTADFLRTIRDESGLLTGWEQENYGFMHIGFQEYLAAREIQSRALKDPGILRELASLFGESWWQEVALLMLALDDPSVFEPYMREVVKRPAFSKNSDFVKACLDEAAEPSAAPFMELLKTDAGTDADLWKRQLVALHALERLDSKLIEDITPKLLEHPSEDIRQWIQDRTIQAGGGRIFTGVRAKIAEHAERKNTYISKIELMNIRCFEAFSLDLKTLDDTVLWTMILGDNATGKTTLLRSIALGLCDEGDATALVKKVPGGFIRKGEKRALIRIILEQVESNRIYEIDTEITKESLDSPEIVRKYKKPEKNFPWKDIFVCGYGPRRSSVADASHDKYTPLNSVRMLFDYEAPLQNPEIILLRQDPQFREILERKVLDILMLDDPGHEIVYPPKKIMEIRGRWGIQPYDRLSDGYKSTVQWVLDFIGWSIFAERFVSDREISGILLIDELEQHLHPKWQRHIVQRLKKQFPMVQFIATTHSPLVASSVGDLPTDQTNDKLIHLGLTEDAAIEMNELPDTTMGLTVDQFLASEAFDYLIDADPRVENMLAEASRLAGKGDRRSKSENERYESITTAIKGILDRRGRTAVEMDVHKMLYDEMKKEIKELERKVFGENR